MRPTPRPPDVGVGNASIVGRDLVRGNSTGNAQSKRGRHHDDRVAKLHARPLGISLTRAVSIRQVAPFATGLRGT